ncbi:MAG: hypothetical protein RDU24_08765 [Humidesulfovibrio sp.]|uniref:hypothetical protein n=1 Tax=Humidesulfovibrio sp. TaxID=2910988 RepID=UPI0027E6EC3A|nr:hypothetical protein [Humidesulfovibrio sp.]MDQ7835459.1 hypothetical protein [Humidesulfovibrio sp.]
MSNTVTLPKFPALPSLSMLIFPPFFNSTETDENTISPLQLALTVSVPPSTMSFLHMRTAASVIVSMSSVAEPVTVQVPSL